MRSMLCGLKDILRFHNYLTLISAVVSLLYKLDLKVPFFRVFIVYDLESFVVGVNHRPWSDDVPVSPTHPRYLSNAPHIISSCPGQTWENPDFKVLIISHARVITLNLFYNFLSSVVTFKHKTIWTKLIEFNLDQLDLLQRSNISKNLRLARLNTTS